MQKTNLNSQRPPPYKRRKCISYKPNDYFDSFDQSQHAVMINYEKQAEAHMIKSLAILLDNIRNPSKPKSPEPLNLQQGKTISNEKIMSVFKNPPTFKKNIPQTISEEQEEENPQKELQDFIQFEKTGKKIDKSLEKMNFCKEEKKPQPNQFLFNKHSKLMESLKKLSISDENDELKNEIENLPHMNNRGISEDTNLLDNDDSIKNKSLEELISQSAKAPIKKCFSPIQSEDSEYNITDYSSNESSNGDDNDYEEREAFDSDKKPLFGTLFAQGGKNYKPNGALNFTNGSEDSQVQPKLNFKPIMDSPKKTKSKKKRVYVNKKKVPRWAEDLKHIAEIYGSEHQRELRKEFKEKIGICIVENMQTNPIFNRNDSYNRSSTVKWTQHNSEDLF